jgi:GT2 family glycosyltransferase
VTEVERETDYVCGVSVLATRRFLEEVGLMEESYFLYFEELDWAVRGAAFARVYAHDSVVYHREGRSTGASTDWRKKSELSDYYTLRSRLLFTRRFFPSALPTVYCGLLGAALNRLLRRQFGRAGMVLDIMRDRGQPPLPPRPASRRSHKPRGLVRP